MGLGDVVRDLIVEMDRDNNLDHRDDKALLTKGLMPDFATAKNGLQRTFTKDARTHIDTIASTMHDNSKEISSVIQLKEFKLLVRQCVADLHADEKLLQSDCDGSHRALTQYIQAEVSGLASEYTHYFAAWTVGAENSKPLTIGPVTLMNRDYWIDTVDFPDEAKERYLGQREENFNWRANLRAALASASGEASVEGLTKEVYSIVNKCPSVLKVTVRGYERNYSKKLAEIVCKSALDSVSLALGGGIFFNQQALFNERLVPFGTNSLIETKGRLWLPGHSLSSRFPHVSRGDAVAAVQKMADFIKAAGHVLDALVDPASHTHPKLANRWATALDWLAEGGRERSDAIALSKIASSLDVLAAGGKYKGILSMLTCLLGVSEETVVFGGNKPKTLSKLVKETYDDGRSKILHGTHYERLRSFAEQRARADIISRVALIESAIRFEKYSGPDSDTAFRTIPK